MKNTIVPGSLLVACTFMLAGPVLAVAQESAVVGQPLKNSLVRANRGTVIIPKSSVPAANTGANLKTMQANTNIQVLLPAGWKPDEVAPPKPNELPPFPGYAYETPASFGCLYSLTPAVVGCNPNVVVANPPGGSNVIAVVDAYDDPFAGPDLAYFSAQFGLPFTPAQFQVYYEDGPGVPPGEDYTGGWELEESLDIEYSHAMAPKATIYLVEVDSNSFYDLLTGVQIASNLISCGSPTTCPAGSKGKGEVSMSWGGTEFAGQTTADSVFTTPGIVYVASAGDSPGTEWPCTSPNVVCTGGTTVRRNPDNGNFLDERSWELGGGGVSLYEPIPSYQAPIKDIVGGARGVPDVALDSNPVTGAWLWDSFGVEGEGAGWFIVGGTSVAAPTWAGIINTAGKFNVSSASELKLIYLNLGNAKTYNDTTLGDCGPYAGYLAVPGWDPCTGVGTVRGLGGK